MATINSCLRKKLGKELTAVFRQVLYNQNLSYGARCLGLAILDSPRGEIKKNSILSKRLHTDSSTVARWIKELKKAKLVISPDVS